MTERWQPSVRAWIVGAILSLVVFAGFAISQGLAAAFQFLALVLLVDALLLVAFALIHRLK